MSSKKGQKRTKAQKAKQQREEEERRLREEEEARLLAEREEQERLERERKKQELERLELKDRERRDTELTELCHLLEENYTAVTNWKADAAEKAKWERYMQCDGNPDPSVQQDINTYISLWRDDPEVDIAAVLKQCSLALQLTEELEGLLRDATAPQERQRHQEALMNLQELIHSKHLLAVTEVLKGASANMDTETGNMQTVVKDDNVTLCLWANLKKNPRSKGLNFREAGVSFELPKQLAARDIAVRSLHTHYDHLSLLARMAHLGIHTHGHRSVAGGEEVDLDASEQGETTEEGELKGDLAMQQQQADEEGAAGLRASHSVRPAEGRGSQIQTQMEALGAQGDLTSPPLQLSTTGDIGSVRVVDLMQLTPLGGVFYCDVFHLPPQAHQVNGWEIRKVLHAGLQAFQYPTEKSNLDASEALPCPPVGVCVTLPDAVVFLEAPQVARWDAAGKRWRTDGIADVSYEEPEGKISFKMDSFYAFALMQDTYANLPFQSWELRPLGQDSALFTINGAFMDVSIMIQGNQCMLQAERHISTGLSRLAGKWMSCAALQRAILNVGLNIFTNENTDKYVSACRKDPPTEHAAYEQMALLASACAFSWSKWNAECDAKHLVMQGCEHDGAGPVHKSSWSLFLLGAQRSQKLAMTEMSGTFSPDPHPGSEIHSTFIHMLQDNMSTDGIARTRASNCFFIDTVQSLLRATRPLVYS